jgi:hypothetical protein
MLGNPDTLTVDFGERYSQGSTVWSVSGETCDRSVVFSGYSVIENAKNEAKPNQMYFSQAKKKIGCIE